MNNQYFNVYCETTKTCTWKRLRQDDKEDALERTRHGTQLCPPHR